MWALLVATVVGVGVSIGLLRLSRANRRLRTTHLRVRVPDLPEVLHGRRLAFASDLHYGLLYVTPEELLDAIERARPDLLLLGGDYAATGRHMDAALELIRTLAATRPTFGILGNTDYYLGFDRRALAEAFAVGGGELLVNQTAQVCFDGAAVEIVGLDDPGKGQPDVAAALANSPGNAAVRIALVHSPSAWQEIERLGAHLLLCGHTHGGQIRPPGLEAPLTHPTYPARMAAGLFRYARDRHPSLGRIAGHWWLLSRGEQAITAGTASGPLMYVSRGVGTGLVPVRILCPPELVLIELLSAGAEHGEREGGDG